MLFFFFSLPSHQDSKTERKLALTVWVLGRWFFLCFKILFGVFFFVAVSWGFFKREIILKHGRKNASDLFFRFIFYFSNFWFYANVSGS